MFNSSLHVAPPGLPFTSANPELWWVTPEKFGAVGDGVADDTQALQDWMDFLAASAPGTSSTSGRLGANKTYLISEPLVFNASIYGDGPQSSVIKASASFSGGPALLDFNNLLGTQGQALCGVGLDVRALGSGGTVSCIGTSSAGGGGGASIGYCGNLFLISSSLGTHAISAASAVPENGCFTGRVWDNLQIVAPAPMRIGNNQDDQVFNSLRVTISPGATVTPMIFGGANIVLNSPYISVNDTASISTPILDLAKNIVLNSPFFEGSTNSTICIQASGTNGYPTLNNTTSNMAYTGVSAEAALFGVDAQTTNNASAIGGINLSGFTSSTGTSPYPYLFSLSSSFSTARNPTRLNISGNGYQMFDSSLANFAIFRTGTTVNSNKIWNFYGNIGPVFGLWEASSPAAGNPIVFTAVSQPGSWP